MYKSNSISKYSRYIKVHKAYLELSDELHWAGLSCQINNRKGNYVSHSHQKNQTVGGNVLSGMSHLYMLNRKLETNQIIQYFLVIV